MIRLKDRTIRFKAAAGAWGFDARGYLDILWSLRALAALARVPLRALPGLLGVWCRLHVEWFLLAIGVLSPRRFAFTTKTLTMRTIKGNPLEAWIRPIPDGFVNAVGLANPGVDRWILSDLPDLKRRGIRPIVSIAPNTPEEAQSMVERLLLYRDDVLAIELNPGCPNTPEGTRMLRDPLAVAAVVEAAREMRGEAEMPLILKLSAAHDWRVLIPLVERSVDAFELIDSVPWSLGEDPGGSPLAAWGGGGISGPRIFPTTAHVLAEARRITRKPLIACGGIVGRREVEALQDLGADAVAIGTGFLLHPLRLAFLAWRRERRTA